MILFLGHYDRSKYALDLYKTTFTGLSDSKEKSALNLSYKHNDCDETILVSGDIVFNFNKTKLKFFQYVIDNDNTENKDYKNYVKKLLAVCAKFHHSPENITILPRTGALNNIKQSLGNDRLDVFLATLKLYFQGYKSLILSNDKCSPQNMPYLEKFLDSYSGNNSIYNFSKFIYHIDEEFTDKLCEHGKFPIKTTVQVHEYIMLAYKYWLNSMYYYNNNNSEAYGRLTSKHVFLEFAPYLEERFSEKIDKWYFS